MLGRLDERASIVVAAAQDEARRLRAPKLEQEHILVAMLAPRGALKDTVGPILARTGSGLTVVKLRHYLNGDPTTTISSNPSVHALGSVAPPTGTKKLSSTSPPAEATKPGSE